MGPPTCFGFDFVAWREQSRSFEAMVAGEQAGICAERRRPAGKGSGLRVSADYFRFSGRRGCSGADFLADEDQSGRNRVVILSDGLWQRRFGSNPR